MEDFRAYALQGASQNQKSNPFGKGLKDYFVSAGWEKIVGKVFRTHVLLG